MIKKYGLFCLICGALLIWSFVFFTFFVQKYVKYLFPVLEYEESEAIDMVQAQRLELLLPLLIPVEEDVVIAKREDVFNITKLEPVELLTMMELENVAEEAVPEETGVGSIIENVPVEDDMVEYPQTEEVQPAMFVPHTLQQKIPLETIGDYDSLVKNFYTIDSCAMVGSEYLDAEKLSQIDLRITKSDEQPQILIYHTHAMEGFVDSVPGDDSTTIVGVGAYLAQILEEEYGYKVLHHVAKYDEQTRDNAYSRALPDIVEILEENPSIEVIIDLHRDAVNDDYKLVMDLDGRPTARFMFFNGVSCTKKTGKIGYLENTYQLENLAFSFQMKKVAEEYYPGLTRKNYIHGYRYNMHLLPRTTLLELGAQNNTLEEAMNACDPIAHILDMVLSGA